MPKKFISSLQKLTLTLTLLILTGCASVPGEGTEGDPFESFNRAMFSFNDGLDEYILKPVAEGYDTVMPGPVKTGISNFFSNLGDLFTILNDILQFKFGQALEDTGRFIFNTTIGVGGLIDVATPMGLVKHDEDFGQTLATWGIGDGPYIVLPFLGPRTMRGTAGLVVDSSYDPVYDIKDDEAMYGTILLRTIDTRYKLLKATRVVEQAAVDKYSFIRDAYLQNRKNLIYDGNPPEEKNNLLPESSPEDLELEKALEQELEKELGL